MENVLKNLKGVSVYLDDVLVAEVNEEDHLKNLDQVLTRLETTGFTLKKSKCAFALPSVQYLGHVIDAQGLHPSLQKIKAIANAPKPKNISELKSFIGLINYYNKFMPNLSFLLAPLYRSLKKRMP